MPVSFERMRGFENRRVKMCFDDGHEVIALLLSATEDVNGLRHLIYDRVEWTSDPGELTDSGGSVLYAEGESLIGIEEVAPTNA